MAIAENSYPQKMGHSCDPKTWHAHPRMQTSQVLPWGPPRTRPPLEIF